MTPKKTIGTFVELRHLPKDLFSADELGRSKFADSLFGGDSGLAKFADNIFDGIAGLAKFAAGFFTKQDGRAKFEEAFINTALIEDLTVTEAKIANLAVGTAKIQDLAVQTAKINNLAVTDAKIANLAVKTGKIDDLAVTEAKIASAAITNLHLQSACVTTPKITTRTRWQIHTTQDQIVHTFSNTYFHYGGDYSEGKNELQLKTVSANYGRVTGYPNLLKELNPEFKARVKPSAFASDTFGQCGLGHWDTPFAFELCHAALALSSRSWTVLGVGGLHLGLHYSAYAEASKSCATSGVMKLRIYVKEIWDGGEANILPSPYYVDYTITESTKTLVSFNLPTTTPYVFTEGRSISIVALLVQDGVPQAGTMQWWVSSPVKALTIPSGNPLTIYMYVQKTDGGNTTYWYGYSAASETSCSRLLCNFTVVYFINQIASTAKAKYLCKSFSSNDYLILQARFNDAESKYYWSVNETEDDLFNDNLYDPISPLRDGLFYLKADSTGSETLTIYNFIAQEEWMS